jgi:predicted Fe-Mo cluster-binding NifX family protein
MMMATDAERVLHGKPAGATRVAVATDGTSVAQHFGRCESYTLCDVVDGKILRTQVVASPGHEPGRLPAMLQGYEVDCVVAGGMGPRASGLFAAAGIATIGGVQGPVADVLAGFAGGSLTAGESLCEHEVEGGATAPTRSSDIRQR